MPNNALSTYKNRRVAGGEVILAILISWVPFLASFGSIEMVHESLGFIPIKSVANYFAILACGYCFLALKGYVSWRNFSFAVFAVSLAVLNFFLAPYASPKWLINWIGFVFVGVVLVTIVQNFSRESLIKLERILARSFLFITSLFVALFLFVYSRGFTRMLANLFNQNENLWVASNVIGVEKQALGMMFGLIAIWYALSWQALTARYKAFVMCALIIFFPFWYYIRTLLLAIVLVLVWRVLFKNNLLRITVVANLFLLSPLLYLYWDDAYLLLESTYDRLPSLIFSLDTLMSTIWGLGNGGYHVYVEAVNYALMGAYGSENMLRKEWFWLAPESDIVYFIASWGILSVFFFAGLGYLLVVGGTVFRKSSRKMLKTELFMLYGAWFVIFSGISQDNVTNLIWWVMISVGYGVLLRAKQQGPGKGGAHFVNS